MRADARRNREKILAAARELFREQGTAVALDDVARRAGLGIGTLYRRFPDREALIREVAVEGFRTGLAAIEAAKYSGARPMAALEELFRRIVEERERLVMPLIGGPLARDESVRELQRSIVRAVADLLSAGRDTGEVRADVTPFDLISAAAMVCRPMPHIPRSQARALAERHVTVYLHGLRPEGAKALPEAGDPSEYLGSNRRRDQGSGPSVLPLRRAPFPT
ncbi:TetR family transcriptional regulator [Streptomyces tsukubensis]|uniref:TetR family transcriptional regulator n=1 Tax=Streptomyces tsukubensis TaxID=83656 RepID=A0A1V4A9P5_9ACTN|nr:TetR family transcriptional regulator [Streptomyces tsukubensis]